MPTLMLSPFPTIQVNALPNQEIVLMKPFQITETPIVENALHRIHDRTLFFFKYFTEISLYQRPLPQRANQKDLSLKEVLNHSRFLIPQPPWEVGLDKEVQSTRWNFFLFPVEPQRKSKIKLLSFLRMDFSKGTRANQYTGKLVRTALIRTSLPPNDRSLKDQCEILFSNFLMSHN